MKTAFCCRGICLGVLLGAWWSYSVEAQGVEGAGAPSGIIKWHEKLAQDYKSGKTNDLLLLRMDWFSDPNSPSPGYYRVHWFTLRPSGHVFGGASSISNGGYVYTLNKTDLALVVEAINKLPEPPVEPLPYERQIVISGVRSNEWFHAVYDRANIPKEVTEVFKKSRAPLEACKP